MTQYFAYIDETQRDHHYFVGAALGSEEQWDLLEEKFALLRESIVQKFGVASHVEFHGHPLMNGLEGWEPMRGRHREVGNVYRSALRIIAECEIQFLFRGVNVKRLNARYAYPDQPHNICMDHVLERIDERSDDRSLGEIIVVADNTSHEKELTDRMVRNQERGTIGYRSNKLPNISSPLNFSDSSVVDGLQASDLGLYLYQRKFHHPRENHKKAQATRNRLWSTLRPQIVHDHIWVP